MEKSNYATILKEKFPGHLKYLMNEIKPKLKLLFDDFKKYGIVPLDTDAIVAWLPNSEINPDLVGQAFMDSLHFYIYGGNNK